MSRRLCWLHLSGLHVSPERAGRPTRSRGLLDDLRGLDRDKGLRPDLIVFTGDLAFGRLGDKPR